MNALSDNLMFVSLDFDGFSTVLFLGIPFFGPKKGVSTKTSWWFQPIWKILVKLDHLPKKGVNTKCAMVKSRYIGDKLIPPLMTGILIMGL